MYHCLQAGHFSFKTLLYKSKTYAAYLKNAQKNAAVCTAAFSQVEGEGFEPSKAEPTDLQSVPFSHSGIPPKRKVDVSWRQLILATSYFPKRKTSKYHQRWKA